VSIVQLNAPAIGYRAFSWNGGPLLGIGFGAPWPVQREPQVANCANCYGTPSSKAKGSMWNGFGSTPITTLHDAPLETCQCGIYALNDPRRVSGGTIKAVTIGYGKLIVHPDGWRAEKSELIGLIVPPDPSKCQHEWTALAQTLQCSKCLTTKQQVEQEENATGTFAALILTQAYERQMNQALWGTAASQSPSLAALEILAEQYGARVIQNWDDGVALAQEQGAKPIPDEVYEEARSNGASTNTEMLTTGGYVVPPLWFTSVPVGTTITSVSYEQEPRFYASGSTTRSFSTLSPSGTIKLSESIESYPQQINIEITKVPLSKKPTSKSSSPQKRKKSAIDDKLRLMREKRELHAKHWKPDARAA